MYLDYQHEFWWSRHAPLAAQQGSLQPRLVVLTYCNACIDMGFVWVRSTIAQLESGELKIRTRVLESERADRRQVRS